MVKENSPLNLYPSVRRGIGALLEGDDSHGMAERSLICMMLIRPIFIPVIARSVGPGDFGLPARAIVAAELFSQGDKATIHSVAEELGRKNAMGMGSGPWAVTLAAFLDWTVADDDIDGLCRSVVEGSIDRRSMTRGSNQTARARA